MEGYSLGYYRILKKIGAGGMGEVYLAEDTRLNRKVALKVLPENISADKERLRRFEQEAFAASALNHPNILTIYEFGAENGTHFLASEFIKGATLREKLQSQSIDLAETLNTAIQIASALQAAHDAGIIHRDIKPENVMIRDDGYVKVLDFGLAKLLEPPTGWLNADEEAQTQMQTQAGMIMGTAAYMSPEQASGKAVDARTDVFSLGVVLYEMLTRRQPFTGETIIQTIVAILEKEPLPVSQFVKDYPSEIERIIFKSLAKNKDERYQSAKDLLMDLKSLQKRLEFEVELERTASPNNNAEAQTQILETDKLTGATKAAISTKDGIAHPTSSAEYVAREIKQHKRGLLAALSIVILLGIGFTYFFYYAPSKKTSINSVAVLPFVNVGNDPNAEYLSDGISESLINSLSQLPQMKVIARSSAFTYKGKEIDPQEVAKTLGVQVIVTGRVIQRGDNLQISAEMMNANDRTQIWGEQFNRKAADLQTVQSEISKEIAGKLRLKLTGEEENRLTKRYTDNAEAYQFYLKGRYYWGKESEEGFKKAIENFNQAIAIDPHYALAYSGLADTYSLLGDYGYSDPKEAFPKAKFAAQKPLEIDNTLAEAHASLAKVKDLDWDWSGAEREYKRAIELNANYAAAHLYYSSYLGKMERHDEAILEGKRAEELDPLSLSIKANMGLVYFMARRYDQAIEEYQKILEMDSNFNTAHFMLAYVYSLKGMYKEAIAESQKIIDLEGSNPITLSLLAQTYALSGKKDEARTILNQVKSNKEYIPPNDMVQLYAALGDKEEAFKWLQKAYEARDGQLGYLKVLPFMDSLRSDPRFQDLLRRMNFPQ